MSQPKPKTMKPGTFIIFAIAAWCLICIFAWAYSSWLSNRIDITKLDKTVLANGGLTNQTTYQLCVREVVRGATVDVFLNSDIVKTVDGARYISVQLDKGDRDYTFTAWQRLMYKGNERIGRMSEPIVLTLDTLPPTGSLSVNRVPAFISSNEISLAIKAKAEGADYLIVTTPGGQETRISFSPSMKVDLPVAEGGQTVEMMLADKAGNRSKSLYSFEVYVDCTKPVVHSELASNLGPPSSLPEGELWEDPIGSDSDDEVNNPFLEEVWIGFDDTFHGPMEGTVEAPIIGNVKGKLKSLTLDGRDVPLNKDGSIKTRISIPVHRGTMEYEVVAIDRAGSVGKNTIELKWGLNDERADTEAEPPSI
jgi:hypothetical protein